MSASAVHAAEPRPTNAEIESFLRREDPDISPDELRRLKSALPETEEDFQARCARWRMPRVPAGLLSIRRASAGTVAPKPWARPWWGRVRVLQPDEEAELLAIFEEPSNPIEEYITMDELFAQLGFTPRPPRAPPTRHEINREITLQRLWGAPALLISEQARLRREDRRLILGGSGLTHPRRARLR